MKCANCDEFLVKNERYYRAGKNGTPFCSKECCYEAYENYYSKQQVDKTIEIFIS